MATETELTDEERQELTAFNLVAHSIVREKDGIPPTWLCMSPEAKESAREEARAFIDDAQGMGFGTMPLVTAEKLAGRFLTDDKVQAFIDAESHYKAERVNGNPRAYFAE